MGNSLTSFVRLRYSIYTNCDPLKSVMRSQKLITVTSIKIASVLNRTFSSFFSQTASFLGPMAQLCHRYSNLAHTVWVDLFPQLWNLLTEKQQQVSFEILPTLVKRNNVFLLEAGALDSGLKTTKFNAWHWGNSMLNSSRKNRSRFFHVKLSMKFTSIHEREISLISSEYGISTRAPASPVIVLGTRLAQSQYKNSLSYGILQTPLRAR